MEILIFLGLCFILFHLYGRITKLEKRINEYENDTNLREELLHFVKMKIKLMQPNTLKILN